MVDFSRPSISQKDISEVVKVLKSGWLTTGYKTKEFSERVRKYIGSKYCIPVSSCTAALHLALLCAGVKTNDEVITTPHTFISTINTILYLGAKPVFVDIKPNDYIIDEGQIEKKITKKTKAIVAVHYGGFSANLQKLQKISKKYRLQLIEDAAHSFGSKYKNTKIGKTSSFCCFSFYPTKNITTIEGGALVTNNAKFYKKAQSLALHGITNQAWKRYAKEGSWRYDVVTLGYKYNLSNVNAALGISQLERINKFFEKREALYDYYKRSLSKIDGIEALEGNSYSKPFRHLFIVKIVSNKITRDSFIEKLKKRNIICSVHFVPVYKFTFLKYLKINPSDFPNTEEAFRTSVSLPFGSEITSSHARYVISEVKKILN